MNPTIPLITMGCCALLVACTTVPDRAQVGDPRTDPDLATFFLPRVQMKDATLETALHSIRQDYEDISRRSGETPRRMRFDWKGAPERRVNLDLRDVSALTAIRRLALQAGMKASAEGDTIALTNFAVDPAREKRTFPVPPTFLTEIGAKRHSLEMALRQAGALTAPEATARYDPSQSMLTVHSSMSDLERVSEIADLISSQRPFLVKLNVKRLTLETPHDFPTGLHDAGQTERGLQKALAASGHSIYDTLPSLTARPGQSGTIETIREYFLPNQEKRWLGTRVEFEPALYGQAQIVRIDYERNLLLHEGKEIAAYLGHEYSPQEDPVVLRLLETARAQRKAPLVHTRTATINAIIPDGFYLIEKTKGTSRVTEYVLFRATRLDFAGQPVRQQAR